MKNGSSFVPYRVCLSLWVPYRVCLSLWVSAKEQLMPKTCGTASDYYCIMVTLDYSDDKTAHYRNNHPSNGPQVPVALSDAGALLGTLVARDLVDCGGKPIATAKGGQKQKKTKRYHNLASS